MRQRLLAIAAMGSFVNVSVAQSQSFSLTISTPHSVVRVGDQIRVDVVLVNITDHGISRPPVSLNPRCDYRIRVEAKTGLTTSEPCAGSRIIGFGPLKPQESIVAHISLTGIIASGIFDFSMPGDYEVQFSRWDPDNARIVKSNKITIKVLPMDTALESPPNRK